MLCSPVGYNIEGFDPDISVDDLRGEPWPFSQGNSSTASPLKGLCHENFWGSFLDLCSTGFENFRISFCFLVSLPEKGEK
jgi:hypothetical protein